MCGNAIMYDALNGKILTVGGSPNYQNSDATANAHVITIGTPGSAPSVVTIASMAYARAFANAVVLPDGKVFITGGQVSNVSDFILTVPDTISSIRLLPNPFSRCKAKITTSTHLLI